MDEVSYRPIGTIHSQFHSPAEAPIQPAMAQGVRARVELREDLAGGLDDLDGFSHIFLIYHLHLSATFSLKVVPFLDRTERGVFATRSPRRPNPIGISVVKLVAIEKNVIVIEDADMVDGTPLLDIKPYVPFFDSHGSAEIGWLSKARFPRS